MKEILLRYIFTLLHPFQVHQHIRLQREGVLPFGGDTARYQGVDYYEALAVSWLFFLAHCFYSPIVLHLSLYSRHYLEAQGGLFPSQEWGQGMLLIKLLAAATFFPLVTWLWVRFWDMMIRFFAELFNLEGEDVEQASAEIARNSLVGHAFLIIPIFGGVAQSVAGMVLLYAGLRKNLLLSRLQSLLVIASPLFLFLGLIFLCVLSLINIFY